MRIQLSIMILFTAFACTKKQPPKFKTVHFPTSPDLVKGEYFDSLGKKDSAFYYYYEVAKNAKDSFLSAMAYTYMANIQQDAGDFYGAQESALNGINLLNDDSLQRYSKASLYNNLGRTNASFKYYDKALEYYDSAIKIQPYPNYQNTYRNNIAVAFREKGEYNKALQTFRSITVDPGEDRKDFARRTTNLASLMWKTDPKFNPLPDLHNALHIRIQENDDVGITASFKHLLNYYQVANSDSALFYAKQMYASSLKTNSADDHLEALRKLILLSPPDESKKFSQHYLKLSDSVQMAQITAKNQFAFIRYESNKSKAENRRLQESNAQKELQILRQRVFTYGSILAAILIVSLAIWRYRKKRQQTRLEAEASIRENQLKISQKIHDNVANGLYRVMSEIEHVDTIDKNSLLDKIEDLYERSRDISYDPIGKESDTALHISQLLTSFATPETKISVVGNKAEFWKDIPSMIVKELEQVLQELMVNMKKHSSARHVVLHFSKTESHLSINYKDDGKGFPSNFRKGNGLKSTGIRINRIDGEITFAEQTANGAAINILIPILSNDQKSINS